VNGVVIQLICGNEGCRVHSFDSMMKDKLDGDGCFAWYNEGDTAWSALRVFDCPGCGDRGDEA